MTVIWANKEKLIVLFHQSARLCAAVGKDGGSDNRPAHPEASISLIAHFSGSAGICLFIILIVLIIPVWETSIRSGEEGVAQPGGWHDTQCPGWLGC